MSDSRSRLAVRPTLESTPRIQRAILKICRSFRISLQNGRLPPMAGLCLRSFTGTPIIIFPPWAPVTTGQVRVSVIAASLIIQANFGRRKTRSPRQRRRQPALRNNNITSLRSKARDNASTFKNLVAEFISFRLQILFIMRIRLNLYRNRIHNLNSITEQGCPFLRIITHESKLGNSEMA